MSFKIIILPSDRDCLGKLHLPSAFGFWFFESDKGISDGSGNLIDIDEVIRDSLGFVTTANTNKDDIAGLQTYWADSFGLSAPEEIKISDLNNEAALAIGLLEAVVKDSHSQSEMNARYSRELSLLRRQHEDVQQSFRKLEDFVYSRSIEHRQASAVFYPSPNIEPIILAGHGSVEARIPDSSPGLSDFAIWIGKSVSESGGILTVSLHSRDADEKLAVWEVGADRLLAGWNRFSLERALGPDPVTLSAQIVWSGDADLAVMASNLTADDRFATRHGTEIIGKSLAFTTWKFVAGATAPIPARAHAARQLAGGVRRIDAAVLRQAIAVDRLQRGLPLVDGSDAVLLHVPEIKGRLMSCYLPDSVDKEAVEIIVDAKTRHANGPIIEYCAALASPGQRPHAPGAVPEFEAGMTSGWIGVRPDEDVQLRIAVDRVLEESQDLWLMVRLGPDQDGDHSRKLPFIRSGRRPANAFGWSSFTGATIRLRKDA